MSLMIFRFTVLSDPPAHAEREAAPFEAKKGGPWDEDQKRHLAPGEAYQRLVEGEDGGRYQSRFDGIKDAPRRGRVPSAPERRRKNEEG